MIKGNSGKPVAILAVSALTMVALSGCSYFGHNRDGQSNSQAMDLNKRQAEISTAKAQMNSNSERKVLMSQEANQTSPVITNHVSSAETQNVSTVSAQPVLVADSSGAIPDGLFPPNPQPGECYARVLIPAQYETTTEQVVKREAGSRIETIPAKFASGQETVVVREASTKLVVVPAEYETVTEQVMVKPASSNLLEVPPKYRTVTEKVLDKAAHTVWKRGAGGGGGGAVAGMQTRIDESTGEIMCLVEVPATYRTITKTVLETPASVTEQPIPAEYRTVTRRVLKTPASTKTIEIPAEYKTVQVQKIASPPQTREIPIPAEYQTVSKRTKITDEVLKWRQVLCDVNMTPSVISQLQSAVQRSGYYNGPIDGLLGPMTIRAVNKWAEAQGLPIGDNYIAIETAQAMGVAM